MNIFQVDKNKFISFVNKKSRKEVCRIFVTKINLAKKEVETDLKFICDEKKEMTRKILMCAGKWVNISDLKIFLNPVKFNCEKVGFLFSSKNVFIDNLHRGRERKSATKRERKC